jgi:hypothetical protein
MGFSPHQALKFLLLQNRQLDRSKLLCVYFRTGLSSFRSILRGKHLQGIHWRSNACRWLIQPKKYYTGSRRLSAVA